MSRPRSNNPRSFVANVRLTDDEREDMELCSQRLGYKNISEYLRSLHAQIQLDLSQETKPESQETKSLYPKKADPLFPQDQAR